MRHGVTMITLTRGSVPRHLLRLAWPLMLAFGAQMLFNVVDRLFVSRMPHGDAALAAMGVGFPFVMLMIGISSALAGGISSSVARSAGRGSEEATIARARQGFTLSFMVALGLYLLIPVALWVSRRTSAQSVYDPGDYLIPVLLGAPLWTLAMQTNSTTRALGTTKGPMLSMLAGLTVNAILDPLLIFGAGPIPAMGLSGAAWGTVAGRGVQFAISALCLHSHIGWRWIGIQWNTAILRDILAVSFPSLLSNMVNAGYMSAMYSLLKSFGTVAQAVLNTVGALDQIIIFPLMGLAIAGSTVVSQNHGAGLPDRVRTTVHWTVGVVFSTAILISMLYFTGADLLASFFSDSGHPLHHHLAAYMHINAFALPLMITGMSVVSYFNGVGRGWPALGINLLRTFGTTIPLMILFIHLGMPLEKIWWALPAAGLATTATGLTWVERDLSRLRKQSQSPENTTHSG